MLGDVDVDAFTFNVAKMCPIPPVFPYSSVHHQSALYPGQGCSSFSRNTRMEVRFHPEWDFNLVQPIPRPEVFFFF